MKYALMITELLLNLSRQFNRIARMLQDVDEQGRKLSQAELDSIQAMREAVYRDWLDKDERLYQEIERRR